MTREVPLAGFQYYTVDENGVIYKPSGKPLYGTMTARGYIVQTIMNRQYRTNRLVCESFHGQAPSENHQAAHKDGDRSNNKADNLYWATAQENTDDKITHGTIRNGENINTAKLETRHVIQIRELYEGGMKIAQIHREYFPYVCRATVSHIAHRRIWKHV